MYIFFNKVRAGNINIGGGAGVEVMDLSASSLEEQVLQLVFNIIILSSTL